ncbi:MAG: DUF885 domain-containing protein [Pseudomonadota bacterium]
MRHASRLAALASGAAALALFACSEPAGTQNQAEIPAAVTPPAVQVISEADQRFDDALESITTEMFRMSPEVATFYSVSEEVAGGRYKDRFSAPGLAGYQEAKDFEARAEATLKGFDPAELSPERAEYLRVLLAGTEAKNTLYAIADEAGYALAGGYNSPYIVTQIGGVHVDLPQFMTQNHALATVDDAQAYIERLNQFYEQFAGAIELIDTNASAGALPPDYAVSGAIRNAEIFIASAPEENPLYTHFAGALENIDGADTDALLADAKSAIEGSVYTGYQELISTLQSYQEDTTHDAGIWDIPRGPEVYELLVKVNGEGNISADDVHELGKSEVARIQAEMEALFTQIGMTEGTAGERLAAITASPEQVFPNTPEGKEMLLAYVRELGAEAEKVMGDFFLQTPKTPFEVRPVPAYAEQGAPGGYYNPPSVDGSRPGIYFINLRDTAAQPKFSLPTLTYHEAVPGHHFQLALATEAAGTPLLVRQAGSTGGYAEGWALYSEQFAKEIGLYDDDPYGDIGRLRDELFRAVRLVVDSGMHAKKWSREEAIDYMVANAGMNPGGVATEIERYSVWPGQALSYKIGMLHIQDLRAKAAEELGDDFNLPAFHYQILRDGGAPLDVLTVRIDEWIAAGGPVPDLD